MTPVGTGAAKLYSSQSVKTQANSTPEASAAAPLKVEQNKVTLSDEGKALLAALQELEKDNKVDQNKEKTVGDKVESFAHGALGLDHPDKIPEEEDDSYSAGQYLSAAATIGGLLLLL
ncbi:hypothetical protein [Vibrio aestuarianus]|uniref:hypothetical protein n=1 Tax=Vibrio aestuarianus TaxID=28171 RepID=UPI0006A639D4|nr:hypothetical protein [Vibrio aestuarianus]KOE82830.1 hypothetical protein ACS86_08370 [Vibrio alginolyticus]MDE1213278.1 hypothetical protein [Vibrio aestuarianus]MDE1217366.1 hypothetical protein [Vibrio aestuarianus]MDE1219778.1 hypothetical protein [Vibrio aestuarianus]MDE1260400.1 hypothetical protein [Vibrio aestuarianus]